MRTIRLRTNGYQLTAARDTNGVAHVRGVSWLDTLFGIGYLHVLDRGTQMLFARSVANGSAADSSNAPANAAAAYGDPPQASATFCERGSPLKLAQCDPN